MNNNKTLTTHIKTDPNAIYHGLIGMCVSLSAFVLTAVLGCSMSFQLCLSMALPLLAGIGIEIVQRVFLNGKNTTRESIMDALTTWLWIYSLPILFINRKNK